MSNETSSEVTTWTDHKRVEHRIVDMSTSHLIGAVCTLLRHELEVEMGLFRENITSFYQWPERVQARLIYTQMQRELHRRKRRHDEYQLAA